MAQVTVRDLAESEDVDFVGVADVNFEGAKAVAERFETGKAYAFKADVREAEALRRLVGDFDVVVNPQDFFRELGRRGIRTYESPDDSQKRTELF